MNEIANLRNLGPKTAQLLERIGVQTQAELKALGPLEVFARLRLIGERPSVVLLYALHGALHDCDWRGLEPEIKLRLQANAKKIRGQA